MIFEKETSTDFFEELIHSLHYLPNYRKVYSLYSKVFHRCLDNNTSNSRLILSGTFAKTDYLLKEHHASHDLVKKVNDTRVRLRKRHDAQVEYLKEWHLSDLRNICQFIALIYGVKVPDSLVSVFPNSPDERYAPALIGECMRIIVEHWDDEFVYGAAEAADEETVKVCYANGNKIYDFDWTYLKDLFYAGAQINVIRPRENYGVLYPELIIFEPDYLVDISAIARCFTNYAESPLVHLINKLQPSQNSEAIVLGNFAGQLLDEQIHQSADSRTYADSVKEFWKHNAIGLLTAGVSPKFHSEAKAQKINIAKALGVTLPNEVSSYNPKEGMVEPSFFSEMLGLQGRMDYLQLDYKVLLEQKSGKGEFPYDNFVMPRYKEEHYVQMLLYMMLVRYNFHETYDKNNYELSAFLLYSKYRESLLGLGFAPQLIFRALKVRNELACAEFQYTKENGFKLLDTLTPEQLNEKHVSNSLWINYQKAQIEEVLSPIHHASDLEKAYYFRFLSFIANEHMLSKLGNQTKENSGFASKWHDSLEEKLQAGNIYDNLKLISPDASSCGNIRRVILRFSETDCNDMSNFRIGDIVILYPYETGTEPDVRKTMVFRSFIENIETDTIELALRATQSDARVFLRYKDKSWAIEHDFMESSYGALYRGMQAFLTAPKSRRDLLLLQREPEVGHSGSINADYGRFNELSTRVKRAKELFLIIGPPGTGKTSFGMLNTLKEELTEPNSNVLLLSFTNRAVDEICSKLYESNIDFIRIGGNLTCSPEYKGNLLSARAQNCQNISELQQMIRETRIFTATTSAMNSNIELFQLKQFSLAIIDEASQILEPHLMGILSAQKDGIPAIRKIVMIGDHKQLPAVVQQKPEVSAVHDVALNAIMLYDCRLSLFERLLNKYRDNTDVVYMLTKQGRMHREIAQFPNHAFYNNLLDEVPLPHQIAELPALNNNTDKLGNILQTRRIAFIDVPSPEVSPSDKVNQTEADIIASLVLHIYEREKDNFKPDDTVGIIVPYRNQIATVRNTIDKTGIKVLHDITIDTVERYQGSQRKYIIYGFTIQKYYQLEFLTNNSFEDCDGSIIDRKLNVAMTRAEEHLILVGNAKILSKNVTFRKLIEFLQSSQ